MNRQSLADSLLAIIWLASIVFLAWIPEQGSFHLILPSLILSFGAYTYLAKYGSEQYLNYFLIIAIVARILVIPGFPNLSDDIFRFIWDGRLWHSGIHPFSVLPTDIVGHNELLSPLLFEELNSQTYYTIYPPVAQLIFWLSTTWPSIDYVNEAIIMKTIHCLFDIGTIILLYKLLSHFQLSKRTILLYALNPLIIIELVANLHHEGIVIFFMVLMLFLIVKDHIRFAGMALAGAISTKLLPVIFWPLMFFYLKGRKRWLFTGSVIIVTFLFFLPIISNSNILSNMSTSADLYLRKFEFNGGIYYLFREVGYWIKGYNTIHILGPVLMSITVICILLLSLIPQRNSISHQTLVTLMIWTYLSYALLSITLHPWYVAVLIPFCLLTQYRTPLIWSGLIMLTYVNYSFVPYREFLPVVFVEYLVVFVLLVLEHRKYGFKVEGS